MVAPLSACLDYDQITVKAPLQRDRRHEKVARCIAMPVQRATFQHFGATLPATANATHSLKAAKLKAFMLNAERNRYAITSEKQCNFLLVF
jgi:hypothetical protein